jgi:hypothetical protein
MRGLAEKFVRNIAHLRQECHKSKFGIFELLIYRGAGKSLARTGRKQATATGDFVFHISYL